MIIHFQALATFAAAIDARHIEDCGDVAGGLMIDDGRAEEE